MSRHRAAVRLAAGLAVAAAGVTGCGFHGIYSLPLPGAAGKGAHTYTVTVQFADALDLVPYSAVKVNNATVGHVKSVRLEQHRAVVVCQLPDKVKLPANAVARVEQTSLLGEKFVEMEPPRDEPARGRLRDGTVIPLARTDTSATVEEVLGALSLLLNGGGLAQARTIAQEVNAALQGREGAVRQTLVDLSTFVAGLDRQKADIVRAIEGVDRLTRTVRGQVTTLTAAVDRMPGALGVLADDRRRLVGMLTSVDRLGQVGVRVINASRDDMLANLRALRPTLAKLGEVGDVIPQTLESLITYPTADHPEKAYAGDYGNLYLTVDLSAESLRRNFSGSGGLPAVPGVPGAPGGGGGSGGKLPSVPLPGVPGPAPNLPGTSPPPLPLPSLGGPLAARWLDGTTISDMLLGVLR